MVKILADSTCDLSPSLVSRYKIGIIPLYVHLGEKEYKDGVDITPPALKTSSLFWIKTAPMKM